MAIFSLADIAICVTLLINATALVSGKFPPIRHDTIENDEGNIEEMGVRISTLVRQIRGFSCIIIVWNVFLLLMMIVAFE